jgi:glucoside 3-dehydrogenase (cytochrome c) hitch-hiker subunit
MHRRDALSLMSAVTVHALFASVVAEAAETAAAIDATGEAWVPKWIPRERAPMLEALVDTVLPATDTPGAKQARVQFFVDLALRDCYTAEEQRIFTTGLEALAADTAKTHGRPFEACSPEERHALLAPLDAASYKPDTGARGSFVRILKDLTLVGFFTSQIGATQALAYEKVPGGYRGCVELRPDQKAWATGIGN